LVDSKTILARRLGLTTAQSIQVMYDATLQIHGKPRVPYADFEGVQNMIEALRRRVNPRITKLRATDLVDNSFLERLERSGYFREAIKAGP
jgi:hypothetical protein